MGVVRAIYLARTFTSITALKLYVCALSLYGIASLVWVAKVFENLTIVGFAKLPQFLFAAVLNTDALVQLFLIAGALALVSLLVDLVRTAAPVRAFSV